MFITVQNKSNHVKVLNILIENKKTLNRTEIYN